MYMNIRNSLYVYMYAINNNSILILVCIIFKTSLNIFKSFENLFIKKLFDFSIKNFRCTAFFYHDICF